MTPEAIRTLSQLRQNFYSLFAAAMEVPVRITNRNSQTNNLSMASWVDRRQQLNYMYIFAHTAPDRLVPERPFTIRIAINTGGDTVAIARQKQGMQELNRNWYFELTLLPDQVLDFLPWIVSMIASYETGFTTLMPDPPHPLDCKPSSLVRLRNAKTQKAINQLSQPLCLQPELMPCLNLLREA